MNDRFERQHDLVPMDRLAQLTATVIGVGAIGRQVALQLAAIGARRLELVDFDRVEMSNVTTQGYLAGDVGQLKVDATRRAVELIDPTIVGSNCRRSVSGQAASGRCRLLLRRQHFGPSRHLAGRRAPLPILGRWSNAGRGDPRARRPRTAPSRDHYASTLFPQAEAQLGQCTSRSTIYAAAVAAGLMVHQFSRWLRRLAGGCETQPSISWPASSFMPS